MSLVKNYYISIKREILNHIMTVYLFSQLNRAQRYFICIKFNKHWVS